MQPCLRKLLPCSGPLPAPWAQLLISTRAATSQDTPLSRVLPTYLPKAEGLGWHSRGCARLLEWCCPPLPQEGLLPGDALEEPWEVTGWALIQCGAGGEREHRCRDLAGGAKSAQGRASLSPPGSGLAGQCQELWPHDFLGCHEDFS